MELFTLLIVLAIVIGAPFTTGSTDDLIYGYECQDNRCVKVELSEHNFNEAISLPVCRMLCGESIGTLWPKPNGEVKIEPFLMRISPNDIHFRFSDNRQAQQEQQPNNSQLKALWDVNVERFQRMLNNKVPDIRRLKQDGHPVRVNVNIKTSDGKADNQLPQLTLDTDESYRLHIEYEEKSGLSVEIEANSYFGGRHAIETLAQLIVYDDLRRELKILAKADITDRPAYKWRGLLLDTSRNFYDVKTIKRTLDGLAMVKLNTFHWHITDTHSFPMELKSQPELFKLGAYSPRKVYSQEDIADIVAYGRALGIRVMPEFDAPAHVGEGWQHKNMTACFKYQPWKDYCVEPPCGQLDPTVDGLYDVLEDIYREMFELFDPDVFHMGGDEVSAKCWNSSATIRNWMSNKMKWSLDETDFIRLWNYFQLNALERVDRVSKKPQIPIILWTSRLTEEPYLDEYLDKKRYIIQIWTSGSSQKVKDILSSGYNIIVSNYDALYLDCGGGNWVHDGQNWCSPYIGWQKVYSNDLLTIATDKHIKQVYGAEAAIWSEQIDQNTLDARLWPRASAMAERLWSNPSSEWRAAEPRILVHRERLVENGIKAEALQPEWCLQNQDECPIDAYAEKFQ